MAAEMVTGVLVSTFLERTIDTLASRLANIFRQRKYKKQFSNLKMKFLVIDVVALDAEQKQFKDPRVRDWLLRAKDVVIDAEDLLDEIDYELSKSQAEAESQSATNKVWNSPNSSFVSFFEIEIESRMEQVIEDLEDLANESYILGLEKGGGLGVGLGSGSKLTYTSLPNESVIYGRNDDKEFVFNWLMSDTPNNLSILSIVGMGGMGKTSLAQHVFNDPRLEGKFDTKVWVSVPQEFDVLKVSRAILDTITASTNHSIQQEVIQKRLKEELTGKKFLLVLDDVWNERPSKWEDVQKTLVFGGQGSRILVTTRSKKVAVTMRSEKHFLQVLKEDYCWDLFAKHAFKNADPKPDPDFIKIGKKIVQKCNGLPLALKTIGSLLPNKSSIWEWESIMKSEIWHFSENESDILPALRLSYFHLPPHLKKCFAFCALFPRGYRFDKECLIQLWMAQNFLENPLQKKSPKEVGEEYFNDLLSWSFFQPSINEEEKCFIMHDLLNDLAKYVCEDICIRLGVDEPKGIPKATRHCSFSSSKLCFDGFGSSIDPQKLHTFTPTDQSWHWNCKMSIDDLFSRFKLIRVLSLCYCRSLTEVPKSVGNLKHLRSLDLSYTLIEKLPESISLLFKLQILKLNYCQKLKELPSCLHQLDNLRSLELVGIGVKNVVAHLRKLKHPHVSMSSFHVEKTKETNIQQLGKLNLHGSLTIDDLQNIENPSYALEVDLKNKPHLVELRLKWNFIGSSYVDSEKAENVIENLRPSKYLKKLSISNYIGKQFPNWLLHNSLPNLVSLVLEECESCQHLPPLGLLPFLKDLSIARLDGIVSIDADFHGNNSCSFKSLQKLYFYDMRQWEKWDCQAVTGAFPSLQLFYIENCPKLKGHLPKFVALKSLYVFHCEQLEALIFNALELRLQDCGKLQLEQSTMKKNTVDGHDMAASLMAIVGHMLFDTSLEVLFICSSLESMSDDCGSLSIFPLNFFPTLRVLDLGGFPNLQMISQNHVHKNLRYLTIKECPKLESLPANILLPSLRDLEIENCPKLESFSDGGLPLNLKHITINNCVRLVGSLKRALGDSPSLESLRIEKVEADCFPDEGLLPLSLSSLIICDCGNLKKLNFKGLLELSSLGTLRLWKCPNLQCLPAEGLPKSISRLHIRECPLLEQRCHEGGEDREKVAHIRNLFIW